MLKTQITVRCLRTNEKKCARAINSWKINWLPFCNILPSPRVCVCWFWAFCRSFVFSLVQICIETSLCASSFDRQKQMRRHHTSPHRDQDVCLISNVIIIKFSMRAQRWWKVMASVDADELFYRFASLWMTTKNVDSFGLKNGARFEFHSTLFVAAVGVVGSAHYC